MKKFLLICICVFTALSGMAIDMKARQERKAIVQGNEAYRAKKYDEALANYNNALKQNPSNITALFNKALATTRIAEQLGEKDADRKSKLLEEAAKEFEAVAKHTTDSPELAARANYNRGNLSFQNKEYQEAIDFYKNALRLNPADDKARRNLRIAQQNLPKQPQQNNQDNKDNQDKKDNKDNKDNKEKDQNKDNNQDKNQDKDKDKNQNNDNNKDKDKKNQQPKQQNQDMDKQAADRILKRSSDKENQTRKNLFIGNPTGTRSKGW